MGRDALRQEISDDMIYEIRHRLMNGEYQHRIAASLDINQGRVSEVNTGKRIPSSERIDVV